MDHQVARYAARAAKGNLGAVSQRQSMSEAPRLWTSDGSVLVSFPYLLADHKEGSMESVLQWVSPDPLGGWVASVVIHLGLCPELGRLWD